MSFRYRGSLNFICFVGEQFRTVKSSGQLMDSVFLSIVNHITLSSIKRSADLLNKC